MKLDLAMNTGWELGYCLSGGTLFVNQMNKQVPFSLSKEIPFLHSMHLEIANKINCYI